MKLTEVLKKSGDKAFRTSGFAKGEVGYVTKVENVIMVVNPETDEVLHPLDIIFIVDVCDWEPYEKTNYFLRKEVHRLTEETNNQKNELERIRKEYADYKELHW